MDHAVRLLVLLLVGGGAMTALAATAVWWLEPSRRIARTLEKALGGSMDAVLAAPARGQGAALRLDAAKIAIVRDFNDAGLLFELNELIGAELIFDGAVCARAFRGEGRRALDRIDPEVSKVMLRLVFDDVRDPEFELELWAASDPPRQGQDGPAAVQAARKWFTRLEAVLRQPV
jgi:hypothetical protein